MNRLSFGIGAVLAVVGCSRSEAPSQTNTRGVVSEPGELFQPLSSPAADERTDAVRARFTLKQADGTLRALLPQADVDTFRRVGESFEVVPSAPKNQATPLKAHFPQTASGTLSVFAGGMRADVRPKGFGASNLEWADRTAVYRNAGDKIDVFRVANVDGIEDFYLVDQPRNNLSFSYELQLTNVAGLRLVADTLELLDAGGAPRLRMPTPMLLDSRGKQRLGTLRVSGCAVDTKGIGPWGRPVTAPGASSCTVTASFDGTELAYPVLVDPAWQGTGNTKQSHAYHKLIYIAAGADSGKVLTVGGTGTVPMGTELFDPATQTWAASTNFPTTLSTGGFGIGTNAVGLANGAVFIAGGLGVTTLTSTAQATTALRNPATGEWTLKAAMESRAWHVMTTATIDGKEQVFVAGGTQTSSYSGAVKTAQYYDPATDNWTTAFSMAAPRHKGRGVRMADGRILVVGGEGATFSSTMTSAEIFTPATKSWTTVASMAVARTQPELVAVGTGAIVAGGATGTSASTAVNSVEYFDGTSWKTLTATLSQARWQFASAKLPDGKVLFVGGQYYEGTPVFLTMQSAVADLFDPGSDPGTGTMIGGGSMIKERTFHAAVTIPTLGVLIAGGISGSTETTGSELFNTKVGGACGTGCAAGTTCVDGVCCLTSSCPAGQKCNATGREGVCTKPAGSTCGGNNECASGYCVGGFCCESACTGTCRSCDATGKCSNTPAGKICQGQTECGRTCDATGTCTSSYIASGTKCGASATDAGTGTFCSTQACSGGGSCLTTTNNCGLTCTTSVTCNEATKTCTPSAAGIKAGFCVIDAKCYSYGDINPTDSCKVCDPPSSKTAWSTAVSCMDGSVDTGTEDTGVSDTGSSGDDTGTADDTGSTGDDTGTTGDDTGTTVEDASADAAIGSDLPEVSTCSCRTPGGSTTAPPAAFAALGIALAVAARRRRK